MTMFARVAPGPTGVITDLFTSDPKWPASLTVVQVPNGTQRDWLWDGAKAAPPAPPPFDLTAYATAALAAKFTAGETFNVAAQGVAAVNVLCDGTNDTRADLGLLALFGQANPTGTRTWVDNNGVSTVLTGAQLVTLTTLAGLWVSDCYPALSNIMKGIAAGSITTSAQVDAAFAAVTA